MPRVTVVTATYNWATVLPYSIRSVLDQHYDDFELLVIGDGCTDESADVVGAIDDDRVHWHNLASNTGHQSGPNAEGLRRARGSLIAYLGHDDLWLPNHLETLVAAVDDGAAFVHASVLMVAPDARPTLFPSDGWSYRTGDWIPPTSVLHERRLAEQAGGWQVPSRVGKLDPEAELWARMAESTPPEHVHRATSVKVPAAVRRDVYRARPCHEQAYWLERVHAADDPEAMVLASLDETYALASEPTSGSSLGFRERVVWAVRTRLRRARGRPPVTAYERTRLRRRFKGID